MRASATEQGPIRSTIRLPLPAYQVAQPSSLVCAEGMHRVTGRPGLQRPGVDEIDAEALEVRGVACGEGGFAYGGDTGDLHVADF